MKRVLLSVILVLGMGAYSFGQVFEMGDKVINAGVGFGSTLYSGSYYSTTVPPISVSFEKGMYDNVVPNGIISLGAYIGYSSSEYKSGYDWKYTYSYLILGGRAALHYPLVDNLDTYGGLMLGYNSVTSKYDGKNVITGYNAESGGFILNPYIGARYYFNEKIAAMGELGYGIAYLTLGVAFKL